MSQIQGGIVRPCATCPFLTANRFLSWHWVCQNLRWLQDYEVQPLCHCTAPEFAERYGYHGPLRACAGSMIVLTHEERPNRFMCERKPRLDLQAPVYTSLFHFGMGATASEAEIELCFAGWCYDPPVIEDS